MTANEWVMQFLVGGLFGTLGQAIRVVVGLKKLNETAVREKRPFGDDFSPSLLAVSLLIGFVAGVLGMLSTDVSLKAITRENVLLLVGVGYAGADFIEGFMKKQLPGGTGKVPVRESMGPADDADFQPPVG